MTSRGDIGYGNHRLGYREIPHEMMPAERMFQMITGLAVSQEVYVEARLGIADLLKDGPKGSGDLAKSAEAARGSHVEESGSGSEGKRYE